MHLMSPLQNLLSTSAAPITAAHPRVLPLDRPFEAVPHPLLAPVVPRILTVGGPYQGVLRTAIVEWKEFRWAAATKQFATMIAVAVPFLNVDVPAGGTCLLVPVPARPATSLARGGDLLWELARSAATMMGAPTRPQRLLRRVGRRDQVGLSADERMNNARASFTSRIARPTNDPVVLVDDVATTGATLAACATALRCRGWLVAGAVVLSATKVRSLKANISYGGTARD